MKGLDVNSWRREYKKETMKITLSGERTVEDKAIQITAAYLQAHYVDQSLVGDVNVAQDLSDGRLWDRQVERHKQREDWSKPVRGEGEEDGDDTGTQRTTKEQAFQTRHSNYQIVFHVT